MENRLIGLKAGVGFTGLELAGSDNQVVDNRFRKFETGIFLYIEDEFLGSTLNTVLDENRFENVATDVLTGPGSLVAAAAQAAGTSARLQRYRLVTQP
jgi:hypothetical protein